MGSNLTTVFCLINPAAKIANAVENVGTKPLSSIARTNS